MKKKILSRALCLVLCNLLFLVNILPQELDPLGPMRFANPTAPTLTNPTRINLPARGVNKGMRPLRLGFLGRVGGVAFDGVAKPEDGLTVKNIRLEYSPLKSDGERLSIILNGKRISAPIFDWQLIPIAKFAADDNYSCVTMFGTLGDKTADQRVRLNGGRIINYHEEFTNTLLGVRLFQLDGLILPNFNSYDLHKLNGKYLLGNGEPEPDIEANKKGFENLYNILYKNIELDTNFSSYLISDYNQTTSFAVEDNELVLEGSPYYYFWKLDDGGADFFEKELQEYEKLDSQIQVLTKKNPRFNSKKWTYDKILAALPEYEKQVGLNSLLNRYMAFATFELAENADAEKRQEIFNKSSLEELKQELATLKAMISNVKATEMKELSTDISAKTEMLSAVNPTVWESGINVMRYSAFFRYVKKMNPLQWARFVKQIEKIKTQPAINTPTVITWERQKNSKLIKPDSESIQYDSVAKNIY